MNRRSFLRGLLGVAVAPAVLVETAARAFKVQRATKQLRWHIVSSNSVDYLIVNPEAEERLIACMAKRLRDDLEEAFMRGC